MSQNNPNWRLFMGLFNERNIQVPIDHSHYDQMYQSGCAISADVQVPGSDIYMSKLWGFLHLLEV